MLLFSTVLLFFSKIALSQPEFTPDPFYSYSPNYDANECESSINPINEIINVPLPLQKSQSAVNANIDVSGSIVLLNGCEFSAINFTLTSESGANLESYWYGSFQDDSTNKGMILSSYSVFVAPSARPTNTIYSLSKDKGLQVSFYKFNQFRLYSKARIYQYGSKNEPKYANILIATANIPLDKTSARAPFFKSQVISDGSSTFTSDALEKKVSLFLLALVFYRCF